MIPDAEGIYAEQEPAQIYDPAIEAYKDTTGRLYDHALEAWRDVWPEGTRAYAYGAANETITIIKDGVMVAQVSTNNNGKTDERIQLGCGIYQIAGSVSGWTEEQEIDSQTDKIRAMPEGALYWYGNECEDVTGGWSAEGYDSSMVTAGEKHLNDFYGKGPTGGFGTNNLILLKGMSKINFDWKGTSVLSSNNISLNSYFFSTKQATWPTYGIVKTFEGRGVARIKTEVDISDMSGQPVYMAATGGHNPACSGYYYAIWLN